VVCGSPAVVTETVYALVVQRKVPLRRLRLVTTQLGREEIERQLLRLTGRQSGGWHLLSKDFPEVQNIDFNPRRDILMPKDTQGNALEDIRTTQDNDLLAETLLSEVRYWCAQNNTVVHASVAGGRKTMSLMIGYAMQLVARPQDRLYHVLVPPEYEGLEGFFYPTPRKQILPNRQGVPIDASKAALDLAEIPFVRLRALLSPEELDGQTFGSLVQLAQHRLSAATEKIAVRLNPEELSIEFVDGKGRSLTQGAIEITRRVGFYLYLYLCQRRRSGQEWVTFFDEEGEKRIREIIDVVRHCHGEMAREIESFESYIKDIKGNNSSSLSAQRTE
jgi:CRISPR-associated protein (TIGR02584 family)